jgi:polar amino acid transport system substrate-binding protein
MTMIQKLRNGSLGAVLLLGVMAGWPIAQAAAQAPAPAVFEPARAALPAKVRDEGVLKIATALQWAPFAYRSEKDEAVGIDISLMKVISAKLGLKFTFDDLKFPAIIPGITTGRYHVGVDQLSMSPERLAVVDMIPYFDTTSVLLIQAGKPAPDPANLCGLTFVVTQGSVQVSQLNQLSEACVAKGAKPITQQLYPSSAETLLAIANGRGDAFLTAGPQGVYISRINAKVQLVKGDVANVQRQPAGIALEKGNAPMRKAIALALVSAMEDGSYKAILDEFGVASSAVSVELVRKAAE